MSSLDRLFRAAGGRAVPTVSSRHDVDPICTRTKSTCSVKQIALLEVNRLLPELRDTRRRSGQHVCLPKMSGAASDSRTPGPTRKQDRRWTATQHPREQGRGRQPVWEALLSADLVTSQSTRIWQTCQAGTSRLLPLSGTPCRPPRWRRPLPGPRRSPSDQHGLRRSNCPRTGPLPDGMRSPAWCAGRPMFRRGRRLHR